MTPEECLNGRELRTIEGQGPAEILFHQGGDAAVRLSNGRGTFEVLATADRAADFIAAAATDEPLALTGFFRRRSGFRADGSRHFIWCLVLISWAHEDQQQLAA